MRPPERETQIVLSSGERLWLPGKFASYRNYQLGLYERAVFALLPSIATNGMTVLDVGASVGLYTLTFSRLVGAAGTVFAFEADGEAFSYLRRNIAANARTNVITANVAVTDRVGSVSFVKDGVERGFVAATHDRTRTATDVAGITLDEYFAARKWPAVDLIKMDIEGGEWAALRGMRELSERNPNLTLVMECNTHAIRRSGLTKTQLSSELHHLGFRQGWVIERSLQALPPNVGLPKDSALYNLLLVKAPG